MGSNQNVIEILVHMDTANALAKGRDFANETERWSQRTAKAYEGAGGEHGMSERHKKESLKFAMASIAGQGGEGMGILTSGLMAGGAAGGVMMGVAVLGSVYENAKKEAIELAETQERHKAAIRESVEWMHKLSDAYTHTTRAGSAYGDRAREKEKEAFELQAKMDKEDNEKGIWGQMMTGSAAIFQGGMENTSYYKNREENIKMKQEAKRDAADARQAAAQEQLAEQQSRAAGEKAAVKSAQLVTMGEGPEKRRQELQIKQQEERRKFREETQEAERQFARELLQPGANVDEVKARQAAYGASRSKQFGSLTERQGADVDTEKFKDAQELESQKLAAQEASINMTETGYGKEKAMLDAKHGHEKQVLEASHADKERMGLLESRQASENKALDRDISRAWSEKAHAQAEAYDVVTHKITAAQAAALDLDAQLHKQYGKTKTEEEIARIVDAFKKLSNAQVMQPIIDQTAKLGTEFSHITRQMGDIDYYKKQIYEAHPGEKLDGDEVEKQARARYKNDLASEAMAARKRYRPMDEYKNDKLKVDAEVANGLLTADEGRSELESKIRQLGGAQAGGEFTGAEDHWKSVQSSLMKDDDTPRETLRQIQQLTKEFELLRTNGIPLKRS